MLKVLAANPERWPEIFSFSRGLHVGGGPDGRGGAVDGEQIRHLQMDFLGGKELIAKDLVGYGVHAEYVFWFAYLDGPERDEENGMFCLEGDRKW